MRHSQASTPRWTGMPSAAGISAEAAGQSAGLGQTMENPGLFLPVRARQFGNG